MGWQLSLEYALKELATCSGKIQDLSERKLGLENRQFIAVTCGTVFGPEWMRQAGELFAEHRIDFFAIERITEFLQARGVLAGQYAIVQGFKANAFLGQLALDPFMAVNAELNGMGKVGTKFDTQRTEVLIQQVEVVMIGQC